MPTINIWLPVLLCIPTANTCVVHNCGMTLNTKGKSHNRSGFDEKAMQFAFNKNRRTEGQGPSSGFLIFISENEYFRVFLRVKPEEDLHQAVLGKGYAAGSGAATDVEEDD